MARDLVREAAWAKDKYRAFRFAVSRELGEALVEHLNTHDIKQSDWFRTMIENTLAQAGSQASELVQVDRESKPTQAGQETDTLAQAGSQASELVQVEPAGKPIKRKQPSQEQLQTWHELNQSGKSFSDIEKMPEANGYKRSAIHRHVSAYRKAQGV